MNEDLKRFVLLQKQKQGIISEMEQLQDKLSKELSPYKQGDQIPICGWRHEGKTGQVYNCVLTIDDEGIDFRVYAEVLRKDGSISNFKASWTSYDDPKLKARIKELTDSLK